MANVKQFSFLNVCQQQHAKVKWGHAAHIFSSCWCHVGLLVWHLIPNSQHNQGKVDDLPPLFFLLSFTLFRAPKKTELTAPSSFTSHRVSSPTLKIGTLASQPKHCWIMHGHLQIIVKRTILIQTLMKFPRYVDTLVLHALWYCHVLYLFFIGAAWVRSHILLFCSPHLFVLLYTYIATMLLMHCLKCRVFCIYWR